MNELGFFVPAIVAAAQRAPTPAAYVSVRAALTGAPTPAATGPLLPPLVRDCPEPDMPVAVPAPDTVPVDPHELGLPDPSLDWLFAPRDRSRARTRLAD